MFILVGARLAVGSEPRKGAAWDGERLKQLTGDARRVVKITTDPRATQNSDDRAICSTLAWVMTNEAKNLKILENYWAEIIHQHSAHHSVEVYFPGIYSLGAGLDCSGALSH